MPLVSEALHDDVESVKEAYALLIATLQWERDRVLKLAAHIAREHGEDRARQMLQWQAKYISGQAMR